MASSPEPAADSEFIALFSAATGADGWLPFRAFVELALYHPTAGYYRRDRTRVGFESGTDFYTASSSAPLFGELVGAAAAHLLLTRGQDPAAYQFIEIGAETPGGVLREVAHPFGGSQTIPVGEPIALAGRCVVFSNELFDAQPFDRFVRTEQGWSEVGVALGPGGFHEQLHPLSEWPDFLPADAPPGYHFDAPQRAVDLLRTIAEQPWQGLFLAFDYGKSLAELASDTPQGTARAYFQHRQSADLLRRPGQQDLTCHVCWDWLIEALRQSGFAVDPVAAQEAFLVSHAGARIEQLLAAEGSGFSRRKQSLLQLLHPAHLGRKFQVLSAWRG